MYCHKCEKEMLSSWNCWRCELCHIQIQKTDMENNNSFTTKDQENIYNTAHYPCPYCILDCPKCHKKNNMTPEQELAKAIYEALLSGVKPEVVAKFIEKL